MDGLIKERNDFEDCGKFDLKVGSERDRLWRIFAAAISDAGWDIGHPIRVRPEVSLVERWAERGLHARRGSSENEGGAKLTSHAVDRK